MLLFYAILGLGLGDSMHEPHKGSEEFQMYIVFYAILGLGLGDSMHELHKGSEEFQIYVFNAILSFGLGDSMHELHKGSEEFEVYEIFFHISSVHLISSPIHPGEDFVLIEKMSPGERQVAMHTQETS